MAAVGRRRAQATQSSSPLQPTLPRLLGILTGRPWWGASRRRTDAEQHAPPSLAHQRAVRQRTHAELHEQQAEARFQQSWHSRLQLAASDAPSAAELVAALHDRVRSRARL
jgi:hypothetical protein